MKSIRNIHHDTVEATLRYKFRDKTKLAEALTHPSYNTENGGECNDNRRLAFLGDAVLRFVVGRHFFIHPQLKSSHLSDLCALTTSNENLARIAVKHNLHQHLQYGSPQIATQIDTFINTKVATTGLGNDAPKFLADMVEALAGAILEDSGGSDAVREVFAGRLLQPILNPQSVLDPREELKQLAKPLKVTCTVTSTSDGLKGTAGFECVVCVEGIPIAKRKAPTKQMAIRLATVFAVPILKDKTTLRSIREIGSVTNHVRVGSFGTSTSNVFKSFVNLY